jgi:Flp pilus assembly protein TadG
MIGAMRDKLVSRCRRALGLAAARRLVRHQEGAAAVEFGLVALPFLALVFAIMETAMVFFAGQALESIAADSARLVMTGQAQMKGYTAEKFKEDVCARVHGLFQCGGGLFHIDVRKYDSFGSVNNNKPIEDKVVKDDFVYQPGDPGDIVVVRLMYQWPVYVSLLGLNLSDLANNRRLLVSTVAFRNEPYK